MAYVKIEGRWLPKSSSTSSSSSSSSGAQAKASDETTRRRSHSAEVAPERKTLPQGWSAHWCEEHSTWYYWHAPSDRSTWIRPRPSQEGQKAHPPDLREEDQRLRSRGRSLSSEQSYNAGGEELTRASGPESWPAIQLEPVPAPVASPVAREASAVTAGAQEPETVEEHRQLQSELREVRHALEEAQIAFELERDQAKRKIRRLEDELQSFRSKAEELATSSAGLEHQQDSEELQRLRTENKILRLRLEEKETLQEKLQQTRMELDALRVKHQQHEDLQVELQRTRTTMELLIRSRKAQDDQAVQSGETEVCVMKDLLLGASGLEAPAPPVSLPESLKEALWTPTLRTRGRLYPAALPLDSNDTIRNRGGLTQEELDKLKESCPSTPDQVDFPDLPVAASSVPQEQSRPRRVSFHLGGNDISRPGEEASEVKLKEDWCGKNLPSSSSQPQEVHTGRLEAFVKEWVLHTLRRTMPSMDHLRSVVAPAEIVELFQQICLGSGLPRELEMPHLTPRTRSSRQAEVVERAVYEILSDLQRDEVLFEHASVSSAGSRQTELKLAHYGKDETIQAKPKEPVEERQGTPDSGSVAGSDGAGETGGTPDRMPAEHLAKLYSAILPCCGEPSSTSDHDAVAGSALPPVPNIRCATDEHSDRSIPGGERASTHQGEDYGGSASALRLHDGSGQQRSGRVSVRTISARSRPGANSAGADGAGCQARAAASSADCASPSTATVPDSSAFTVRLRSFPIGNTEQEGRAASAAPAKTAPPGRAPLQRSQSARDGLGLEASSRGLLSWQAVVPSAQHSSQHKTLRPLALSAAPPQALQGSVGRLTTLGSSSMDAGPRRDREVLWEEASVGQPRKSAA